MPQSFTSLHFHVIFSTKRRQRRLTEEVSSRLYPYIHGILINQHSKLLCIDGAADHVHLLMGIHPTKALADMVRDIKASSSGWLHSTFPSLRDFSWQAGYAAFTVSRSRLESVRSYIENQKEHHKRVSFEEEYVEFLNRHEINFESRYLWQD